jgi:hypothetical protein
MIGRGMLVWLLVVLPPAWADPLEEALELVLSSSPSLAQRWEELRAVEQQSAWESKIRVGYSVKGTDTEAEGLNGRIEVVIPLFDKKREIEAAKARERVEAAQEELMEVFLEDVQKLGALRAQREETEEMTAFYKDQLEYHKRLEREGQIEAAALWPYAKQAKEAEHAARQAASNYRIVLERVARQYGGARWERLRTLLVAHGKQLPY